MDRYNKLMISARYWLMGLAQQDSEYYHPLKALEYAAMRHTGQRNGGDPEFIHQLMIFHHIRTFHPQLQNPSMVYTLAFLHDVVEDKNVPLEEIRDLWGVETARKLDLLSKVVNGAKKTDYNVGFAFEDVDASVVKGADRANNVSTMIGVFKPERMERYVKETEESILPLLKQARRQFPEQEAVYENLKMVIVGHLDLARYLLKQNEV